MLKFIDLFAGIGGIRKGFELACEKKNITTKCVFTSEIKPYAIDVLRQNHPNEEIHGDITKIEASDIPDFDILLGGFPCQAFSAAGKRLGFEDTRGTLFFDVARIIQAKQPSGFILENVEGLVNHDKGKTFKVIMGTLNELGYQVNAKVLNAKDFGVPQDRKRIYIVGTKESKPILSDFNTKHTNLYSILEKGLTTEHSNFIDNLFSHFTLEQLEGKAIKDKRGGKNNIHSWDIEIKGKVSPRQRELLNTMMTERRKKKWAEEYGIDWMDGMALSLPMIQSFFPDDNLEDMLDDLVTKGYLVREYPKKKVGNIREQDPSLPLGYNIVAGKLSFEVSKILDRKDVAPTLVAMDMHRLFVPDGTGIRKLTLKEGLRLFGYPDNYKFDVSIKDGYDLLGNTVVVPVIEAVADKMISALEENKDEADCA